MTVDESLKELLRKLDLEVCDSISAIDAALDNGFPDAVEPAVARYKAYKGAYDHFRHLFPNITY